MVYFPELMVHEGELRVGILRRGESTRGLCKVYEGASLGLHTSVTSSLGNSLPVMTLYRSTQRVREVALRVQKT